MQLVLHVEQFFALRGQHALHGDARPPRNHLGYVLRIHLLLYHRVAASRGQPQLLLQGVDLLLGLDDLAVTYLGHLAVIALTLGLLRLDLQTLDRILVRLYLLQQIALALPFGTQGRLLGFEFLYLARQVLDALFVVLAAYRLAFDLELADAAVEVVDILGNGVHLQTQVRRRLVDEVDGLVGQESRGYVAVRQLHGRERSLSPRRIDMASSVVGSSTITFWKRRSRALSCSKYF